MTDLRYAVRTLAKSPGFTAAVVTTLALGIGANTAIFSVFYGVLLRPLPYADPDRLVGLAQTYPGGRGAKAVTYVQFQFLERQGLVFESLAGSASVGFNLSNGIQADRVRGLRVSQHYFRVLGVAPALGRAFLADEDQPNGPSAIILSDGLWRRRFGGDPAVIGRIISLDGRPTTVVGVMPPSFRSPNGAEAWSTLAQVGQTVGGGSNVQVIGRLRPDLTLAQARAGMARMTGAFRNEFSRSVSKDITLDLDPYRAQITADLETPVRVLLGAIGFVLLIACANVASLLLGRTAAREHELALRTAMGASPGRLVRQLLTESVLLALAGGAVGLVVAALGLDLLVALTSGGLPATAEIRLDGEVLGFTLGLSLVTGLAFGVIPAWQAARMDPHDVLKEASTRAAGSARRAGLRHALVVAEVALSLVLLVGAGLLIQTFGRLISTDPGFDPGHLVAAEIWLTGTRYDSTPRIAGFYRDLTSRVEALPDVEAAAVVEAGLPLEQGGNMTVSVDGEDARLSVDYRSVTPGFFETLGVSVTQGRDFTATDVDGAVPVVVVNESFAHRFLGGGSPLSRRLTFSGYEDAWREVVGVVRDVRSFVGQPAPPTVFVPSAQTPAGLTRLFSSWFPIHVVVRTRVDPDAAARQLAAVIRAVDPLVPLGQVRAMDDVLWTSLGFHRFIMVLLSAFAGLAIVLAAVGMYGVISHLVAQRTHEIGVRMAIGARPGDVLRMVLGRGATLTGIGVLLGLAGALALTRLIGAFLYEVRPTDLTTILAVTALLVCVALTAAWLPARRATRVDPMVALRYE
ncbi:MAG TPA: ABC transporter permease [Gemmatimonadales bacterium]|jgi:predicted permease|nr:ABC transporter permease [Gemmatimonadales bacterium]